MDAALSHILNAEGEKLQKIIELAKCPQELIEANQSVHKVISAITQLEYIIQLKNSAPYCPKAKCKQKTPPAGPEHCSSSTGGDNDTVL
jgi:hypothetical protein